MSKQLFPKPKHTRTWNKSYKNTMNNNDLTKYSTNIATNWLNNDTLIKGFLTPMAQVVLNYMLLVVTNKYPCII